MSYKIDGGFWRLINPQPITVAIQPPPSAGVEPAAPQIVYVQPPGNPGMIAAVIGCALAILGILFIGAIFFWLACICTLLGLIRAWSARNMPALGVGALAVVLCYFALATSPLVWIQIAALAMQMGYQP